MPKVKPEKKSSLLRHAPLESVISSNDNQSFPLNRKRTNKSRIDDRDMEDDALVGGILPMEEHRSKSLSGARDEASLQRSFHKDFPKTNVLPKFGGREGKLAGDVDEEDSVDDDYDEDVDENDIDELVEIGDGFVSGTGLTDAEEAIVNRFLEARGEQTRSLADIIMEKIHEKSVMANAIALAGDEVSRMSPKVAEVFSSVGSMLHHYKSGKLPKALKMLPHLKNWEEVLWLTRPDEWSPSATYACTRIFASNLNAKMAQRFYNLVLLEKCRDDIAKNSKLNYHLYMALKKALFKPAAFYKGILLPLVQSRTCTLREAVIIGSAIAKVSVPGIHSAAALLKLAELPYSGSSSIFIRVLLNKRYALPRRVIECLTLHFFNVENDPRQMPVIWHQSLLAFIQRYKHELDDAQRGKILALIRVHHHHLITLEIRRELSQMKENMSSSSMVLNTA